MRHNRARSTHILLSLACATAGCKHHPKPPEPFRHATVAIRGDVITAGGKSYAADDINVGKPAVAKDLIEALRINRDLWKQSHPGERFDGSAEITLPEDASCQTAMNLWVSVSRAGYPRIVLRQAGGSVDFDVYLPGPPPPDAKPPERPPLRLRFLSDGRVAASDTCDASPEILATNRVAPRVWSHEGEPEALVLVGCDPGASARDLYTVLTHLRTHGPFRVSSNVCPMGDTFLFDIAESREYGLGVPPGLGGVQTP